MSVHAHQKAWTVPALAQAKAQGRRLAMLTAYDAGFARVLDRNGIDLVLVGDSLGMVVQGHGSTLPVSVAVDPFNLKKPTLDIQFVLKRDGTATDDNKGTLRQASKFISRL